MPAYLVVQYTCADLAAAKAVWANFDPGDFADNEHAVTVHDAPPVILAGLVKGGEAHRLGDLPLDGFDLLVAADGRMLLPHAATMRNGWNRLAYAFAFKAAEARRALPITWYTHEAP